MIYTNYMGYTGRMRREGRGSSLVAVDRFGFIAPRNATKIENRMLTREGCPAADSRPSATRDTAVESPGRAWRLDPNVSRELGALSLVRIPPGVALLKPSWKRKSGNAGPGSNAS